MKEYIKPIIKEEDILIEDICVTSNTGQKLIDDKEGYEMEDDE